MMGALAATLLPAAVGLALVGLVGPLERRWGVASASAAAARGALAVAVLACLVLWQASQRNQLEHRLEWIRVGRTTTIDWIVQLDGLGLALAVVALAALVLGVVANLAFGTVGGGRPGARLTLAAGGALVLASGGTLVQLAIGVGLVVLALRAWPSDHVSSDMPDRTWLLGLVGAGLSLAILAWLGAAGDFDLMRLERASFAQERSQLVRGQIGGPLFGLPPGTVATLAAGAAALAWALAWPRLLARAWSEGPAPALVATCVAAPALAVVLLRTQVALATAPTALALLTTAAAAAAAWAGIEAARARTSARSRAGPRRRWRSRPRRSPSASQSRRPSSCSRAGWRGRPRSPGCSRRDRCERGSSGWQGSAWPSRSGPQWPRCGTTSARGRRAST
ncbi:hypothetical protein [Nannocystis pusilla]|uniref:hypothetical protein n=1 Tax=Nannocystis pusilla TaxID=889268 RepID=UPI003B77FFFC